MAAQCIKTVLNKGAEKKKIKFKVVDKGEKC
jgi:hypothetical protein